MSPVTRARNGVLLVFALNGFLFASLVARIPDVRGGLDLDNGGLGLLLLAIAVGSVVTLPATGLLVDRFGTGRVVRLGGALTAVGLVTAAVGAGSVGSVALTAVGFLVYGAATGVWDVAMNVAGAEVERRDGRSIMPRFHAAWSVGSIGGAGLGIPAAALHVPMALHLGVLAAVGVVLVARGTTGFLTPAVQPDRSGRPESAWRDPRVLAIGVMVLAFAVVEGSANDWLALALVDGYGVPHWVGVSGYAGFVVAMTAGRLVGPVLLDRFGRAPVLWATSGAAALGVLLVVTGGGPWLVEPGIMVWGLGASLGFPVGMSAAADHPTRSAARVSVVSTIGYAAFLAGPPALGALGDRVGTLDSLLAVAALMMLAALTVPAVRVPGRI